MSIKYGKLLGNERHMQQEEFLDHKIIPFTFLLDKINQVVVWINDWYTKKYQISINIANKGPKINENKGT